jgi:hypothetical protein
VGPRRREAEGGARRVTLAQSRPLAFVPLLVGQPRHEDDDPSDDEPKKGAHLTYFCSISLSSPKTTARAALSSSRSISNSPKVRVSG